LIDFEVTARGVVHDMIEQPAVVPAPENIQVLSKLFLPASGITDLR
jgi:hypothetical protein